MATDLQSVAESLKDEVIRLRLTRKMLFLFTLSVVEMMVTLGAAGRSSIVERPPWSVAYEGVLREVGVSIRRY